MEELSGFHNPHCYVDWRQLLAMWGGYQSEQGVFSFFGLTPERGHRILVGYGLDMETAIDVASGCTIGIAKWSPNTRKVEMVDPVVTPRVAFVSVQSSAHLHMDPWDADAARKATYGCMLYIDMHQKNPTLHRVSGATRIKRTVHLSTVMYCTTR